MKRSLLSIIMLVLFALPLDAQIRLSEGFEGGLTTPTGWGVYNRAPFPIEPESNWTVRDTGSTMIGINVATTSRARSGMRSIQVTWIAGQDTLTGSDTQADAWLISPRVNVQNGDKLRFWAAGGSTTWTDSLQIWLNGTDSLPSTQELHLGSIIWGGQPYGVFTLHSYDLSPYAGATVWIGFRYNMNTTIQGFVVHLDDISVSGPATSVEQINSTVPDRFNLAQNFPNPFNPSTTIEFSIPKADRVSLKVFNAIGAEVATLVDESLAAGTYKIPFDASELTSGMYFYRLASGDKLQTKKLLLLK